MDGIAGIFDDDNAADDVGGGGGGGNEGVVYGGCVCIGMRRF